MGKPQTEFLERLTKELNQAFDRRFEFSGGQGLANTMTLDFVPEVRRDGKRKPNENFEYGDCRFEFENKIMVVIEFESDAISIHNLLKYWPFIRGEMSIKPAMPHLICHFSNWRSYGSHRDLWQWTARQLSNDPTRIVDLDAHQFDHGGKEEHIRNNGIASCIDWLKLKLNGA